MRQFFSNLKKVYIVSPISLFFITIVSLVVTLTEVLGLGFLQIFLLSIFDDTNVSIPFLDIKNFFNYLDISDYKIGALKLLIFFFIFKNFLQIFLNYIFFNFLQNRHYDLLNKFINTLMSKNYIQIITERNTKYNQLFSRYIENFVKNILGSTLKIVSEIIFVFLIIIYLINIKLSLMLSLIFIILIFLILYNLPIKKYLTKNSKKISVSEEILKNYIYEFIKNFREIFIFKLKDSIFKEFTKFSKNFVRYEKNYLFISSLSKNIFEIFLIFFIGIYIFYFIDLNNFSKEMSSTIVVIFALIRLMPSLNVINHCLAQMSQHSYAYDELNNYFKENKVYFLNNKSFLKLNKETENSNKNISQISIENLSFSYKSNEEILKNLNFKFKINEIILIRGKSGSGKTTFIDLVTGILKPTSGCIKFSDSNNLDINFDDFGFVSQNPTLFSNTLMYNLAFKNNLNLDEKAKLLNLIKLLDLNIGEKNDNILDYDIKEDGKNLSGGQLKKISLIRTFFSDPKVIILDEITANLDGSSSDAVINLINNNKKNKIFFIISHKSEDNLKFDKIIDFNKT